MTFSSEEFKTRASAAMHCILTELKDAEVKHPGWPEDKIYAVAILVEEAGEAMQAAIDLEWLKRDDGVDPEYRVKLLRDLRREIAQAGAMALRALINMEN